MCRKCETMGCKLWRLFEAPTKGLQLPVCCVPFYLTSLSIKTIIPGGIINQIRRLKAKRKYAYIKPSAIIPNWVSTMKLLSHESKIRGMKATVDNWMSLTGMTMNIFDNSTRSFRFLGKNKLSNDDLSEERSGLIILFCFWVNLGLAKFYYNGTQRLG